MHQIGILFLRLLSPALGVLLGLLGFATLSTNMLGWFLFIAGVLYAAGTVIVAFVLRRNFWEAQHSGLVQHAEPGHGSFWFLTAGMAAVLYLSPLEYLYLRANDENANWLELTGACVALLGGLLFLWARRSRVGQQVIPAAANHVLRHADYAGCLLAGFGMALGYMSLWGAASLLFILLPAVLWRIRLEEKFVGNASKTSRLISGASQPGMDKQR